MDAQMTRILFPPLSSTNYFNHQLTRRFVEFCLTKIKLLLHFNVRPIMVFDGAHLPMKSHQERLRSHSRQESRRRASELLAQGDHAAAYLQMQKAAEVTPQMAHALIAELRRMNIEFIVAPYEADAQMAWLDRTGKVAAIITEDSDLLLFGCRRVLFKLDTDGWTDEICLDRLDQVVHPINLQNFSHTKFRQMCMLSGCDYLPSINGIGLKTAHKYLSRYNDISRVLQVLRAEMPLKMPSNYETDFSRAEMTFLHQRVYDPLTGRLCFLTPLPLHRDLSDFDGWDFLGPALDDRLAQDICQGRICPNDHSPFVEPQSIKEEASVLPFRIHLDKEQTQIVRSISFSATATSTLLSNSKAITTAVSRITLKRAVHTAVNNTNYRESNKPIIQPRSFAFGPSSMSASLKGIPKYFSPRKTKGPKAVIAVDPKQRSIREFLRPIDMNN